MAKEYRSKSVSGPKSNGGPKASQLSAADPLQCEVVKLYEDLTNFLVTNVTHNPPPFPAWPELNEHTFNCNYTYLDPAHENGPNPSLQFNLRSTWMRKDATNVNDNETSTLVVNSKDELQAKVQYWPLNLDMEKEEFRDRLEFFSESFVFSREQMHVFLRTLGERLSGTQEEDEDMDQVEDEVTAL